MNLALRLHRFVPGRAVYGLATVLLGVAAAYLVVSEATGYWQLVAFGAGPDLALALGAGRGLEHRQLHPRAVRLYNAVHRLWGPAVLVALALAAGLDTGYVVGGLAWAFHVTLDRTVGYGLRTRDGFQRG